jgi:hypothetical protein
LRITFTGDSNSLSIAGGLEDGKVGYSARMPLSMATMHADGKANSCTVASAGIMVGRPDPMLGFPKKVTFAPYAFARNAGAATHVLHMLVNYMDKTGPHSAPLPDRVLAPGEAGSLNLDKAIQLPFTDGSINLSFTLDTGCDSVLMGVGSVDPTGNYVFAVDPAGVGKGGGKSSLYWEVGKGVSTMYSLWNPTSQAEDLVVTVQFDPEGTYKAPVHLEGNASTMLDLMELVEGGKPDADGHTIPPGIRTGSLLIMPAKNDLREFINVVVSSGTYSPLTGTCGQGCETCTGMVRVEIDPGNFMVSIGMGQQLAYVLTDTFGNRTDYTNSSSWSSNQTQVMTVQTMGQSSAGMTAGVGEGSAGIQGELAQQVPINAGQICAYPLPSCPIAQNPVAQASGAVQKPTASRIVSTTQNNALPSGQAPCLPGFAGWFREVLKVVTDQNSPPKDIVASGQSLAETITIGTPNALVLSGIQTGTATTNAQGLFKDTLFACSSLCPNSTGKTNAAQTISDTFNGTGYALTPNAFTYTCTGITINGN